MSDPTTELESWDTTVAQADGSFLAFGSIWVASAAASSRPPRPRRTVYWRCCAARREAVRHFAFPLKNIITMELVSLYASADGYAIGCAIKLSIPAQEQTCVGGLLGYHADAWSIIKGQDALNP